MSLKLKLVMLTDGTVSNAVHSILSLQGDQIELVTQKKMATNLH